MISKPLWCGVFAFVILSGSGVVSGVGEHRVKADVFEIGLDGVKGVAVEVPTPAGYQRVTPEMEAVSLILEQMVDPANDTLANYILEAEAAIALLNEIPEMERTFALKVSKKLKGLVVTTQDFAHIKEVTKSEFKSIMDEVKSQMPEHMEVISEGMSEAFDVDLAMTISQMVPLEPHYEAENALAFSMYINYGLVAEDSDEKFVVAGTAMFVNAGGKVLFLYCFADQQDLEWTRSASQAWAEAVLATNPPPPAGKSFGAMLMDKPGVWAGVIGGIVGCSVGLISMLKKKKQEAVTMMEVP